MTGVEKPPVAKPYQASAGVERALRTFWTTLGSSQLGSSLVNQGPFRCASVGLSVVMARVSASFGVSCPTPQGTRRPSAVFVPVAQRYVEGSAIAGPDREEFEDHERGQSISARPTVGVSQSPSDGGTPIA